MGSGKAQPLGSYRSTHQEPLGHPQLLAPLAGVRDPEICWAPGDSRSCIHSINAVVSYRELGPLLAKGAQERKSEFLFSRVPGDGDRQFLSDM